MQTYYSSSLCMCVCVIFGVHVPPKTMIKVFIGGHGREEKREKKKENVHENKAKKTKTFVIFLVRVHL